MPPAIILRSFFLTASVIVILVSRLPTKASDLMIAYGARSVSTPSSHQADNHREFCEGKADTDKFTSFIAALTSYGQVPHNWFNHFYYISTSASLFWLSQYLTNGTLLKFIAESQARHGESYVSSLQLISAWVVMFLQGSRRLYEDIFIKKSSKSTMWAAHWLVGLGFYAGMSMAVWVEGSHILLDTTLSQLLVFRNLDSMEKVKLFLGICACVCGWLEQNACHRHLASLKKYSLPTKRSFNKVVCPHYTAECLIYTGLSLITAPSGQLLNKTVFCALIFVAVNLGVTANSTKKWYESKFGKDSMKGKWKMIPGLF